MREEGTEKGGARAMQGEARCSSNRRSGKEGHFKACDTIRLSKGAGRRGPALRKGRDPRKAEIGRFDGTSPASHVEIMYISRSQPVHQNKEPMTHPGCRSQPIHRNSGVCLPSLARDFQQGRRPILYQNCTSCHRAGEIGPMPGLVQRRAPGEGDCSRVSVGRCHRGTPIADGSSTTAG